MTMTLLEIMRTSSVIPVIAIDDPEHAVPLARALVAGGIRVLEVTLPKAEAVARLHRRFPSVRGGWPCGPGSP